MRSRWLKGLALLVLLLAVPVLGVLSVLRASLPILDGEYSLGTVTLETLTAEASPWPEITLLRDARGHPTVRAQTLPEIALGLGFLHAQDRFFQMDLSRRLAAGELAALVGELGLGQDRQTRPFRLREVARAVLADATPEERAWIDAYTHGVNEGLAALASKPWEYHLLRSSPEPWRAEDSVLVIHAMWWQLQSEGLRDEISRRRLEARLWGLHGEPAPVDEQTAVDLMALLYPHANEWDTPNFATTAEAQAAEARATAAARPLPAADRIDLRRLGADRELAVSARRSRPLEADDLTKPGSNAWAVAGVHAAADGAALVAGDMHLGLRVPTVWYRASLLQSIGTDISSELHGVTLPGLPAMVAGSNGQVAWSFTNSYGDWLDVRGYPCAAGSYESPAGRRVFRQFNEIIEVAAADAIQLRVREGEDGIVIAEEPLPGGGRLCWLARWLVTEPGATNLRSLALQRVVSVDAALALAPQVGIPHQNFIVGDRQGRIAWTIIGRIPLDERGPETPRPVLWRDAASAPKIANPEAGRIWSANSRHVEGAFERVIGNDEAAGGMFYDTGVRARQIRDRLLTLDSPATTADMLSIQLEDRALMLERWQDLLLQLLDEEALSEEPRRVAYREQIAGWGGRAATQSVGYRIVRAFRLETRRATWDMLLNSLGVPPGDPPALFEGSLWRLVTEQPANLIAAGSDDWRAFLLQRLDAVMAVLDAQCSRLSDCTWGAYNTTRIRHPLSAALGPLAGWLDYPRLALHGDVHVPRVAGPSFGASERFAVAPGREEDAYLHLPGGPSGHPLSPFYRAEFDEWARGDKLPLLPGPPRHQLRLLPATVASDSPPRSNAAP